MTDLLAPDAVAQAPLDLRDRLDYALATIGDTELATVIATAGLAAVHDEWQRTRADLAVQQDCGRALALRLAHLTDEARRWKRRWAGAVAQARHEHERAEEVRGELADYQLAASEQQGATQRDQDQWARTAVAKIHAYFGITHGLLGAYGEGGRKAAELIASPEVLASLGLGHQQSPTSVFEKVGLAVGSLVATADGFADLRAEAEQQFRQAQAEEAAHVDRVPLGVEPLSRFAAVTCWCGHMEQSHVTDGADNAVCRPCVREQTTLHQAFHVHAPEQP